VKLSPLPVASPVLTEPLILSEPVSEKDSDCSEFASTTKPAIVSLVTHPYKPQPVEKCNQGVWRIFGSTFLTIFLAEIGDKTQLATLLISAQSHSPGIVFAGAATALIATSLLGVLIGCWLAKRLSPKTLDTSAGALLLFISVMLLWDVVHF
jgi:putative Ca2+/H+ antiporter (TMEM165/GDT1 family)